MNASQPQPESLRTLIKGIPFAMMTTRSSGGALHCRPMVTMEESSDETLWFFTGRSTHKTADVLAHPLVNLSYSDPATHRYVSVCGRVEVVEDRAEFSEHWRTSHGTWFPLGLEDPDLALLKITVERVDFWQSPVTWIGRTLAFAKALIAGDPAPSDTDYQGDDAVHAHDRLTATQLENCLNWRYAVKRFDAGRQIPADQWLALEQAMVLSPSSYGLQPWRFLVINDAPLRQRLFLASMGQRQVVDSARLVVFAARTDITEADVSQWIDRLAAVGRIPDPDLVQMRAAMVGDLVSGPRHAIAGEWAKRQTYLALGVFLTSAATIGIDACPMEGFDPAAYDEILGLKARGYTAAVIATAGYRSREDHHADGPKVRFPAGEVITTL